VAGWAPALRLSCRAVAPESESVPETRPRDPTPTSAPGAVPSPCVAPPPDAVPWHNECMSMLCPGSSRPSLVVPMPRQEQARTGTGAAVRHRAAALFTSAPEHRAGGASRKADARRTGTPINDGPDLPSERSEKNRRVMSCDEWLAGYSGYLDELLDAGGMESWRLHANECAGCGR
jgi:hypothetical protein